MTADADFAIRAAEPADIRSLLGLIGELADFEKLTHLVQATPEGLHAELFGPRACAEAVLGVVRTAHGVEPVSMAIYFHNFSTFLSRRGLWLEDLYVKPAWRGRGYGRAMLVHVAAIAKHRGCGRFEWSVLDWNEPAIRFYRSMGADVMPDWRICRVTGGALEALAAGTPNP